MNASSAPQEALQGYYALHSRIYDATRWSFLFGRDAVIDRAARFAMPQSILEVGCGTGRNLNVLRSTFPVAAITGLDLSADMLRIAKQRTQGIKLIQSAYDAPVGGFDLILFSYSLSMFNPGWDRAIETAAADLNPGGLLAVVDFSHTSSRTFQAWMGRNHVRMESHLWPVLSQNFSMLSHSCHPAYGGLWHYGIFIGKGPDIALKD